MNDETGPTNTDTPDPEQVGLDTESAATRRVRPRRWGREGKLAAQCLLLAAEATDQAAPATSKLLAWPRMPKCSVNSPPPSEPKGKSSEISTDCFAFQGDLHRESTTEDYGFQRSGKQHHNVLRKFM